MTDTTLPPPGSEEVQMAEVLQALAQEYAELKIEYCALRLAHAKLLAKSNGNGSLPEPIVRREEP